MLTLLHTPKVRVEIFERYKCAQVFISSSIWFRLTYEFHKEKSVKFRELFSTKKIFIGETSLIIEYFITHEIGENAKFHNSQNTILAK